MANLYDINTFGQESYFNKDVTFYGDVNIKSKLTIEGTITATQTVTFGSDTTFNGGATFDGDVSFSKNLTASKVTVENATVTGISTVDNLVVNGNLTANGELRDGDGNFGSAGQVLSSDGTDLAWINTSDANVGSATSIGINLNSDNANQFLTFSETSSGNNPIRVDVDLTYNPSTNTMSGINYSGISTFNNIRINGQLQDGDGDFGTSGQVLASDGTNTNWINAGSLSAGSASEVGITATNDNSSFFITFVSSSTGKDNINVDTNLTYNASTNSITAGNFVRNAGLSSEFLMADGSTARRYVGVGIGSTPGGSGGNTLGEDGDIWYTLC